MKTSTILMKAPILPISANQFSAIRNPILKDVLKKVISKKPSEMAYGNYQDHLYSDTGPSK